MAALGSQKAALAESVALLPPFLRRANTTFVNLRAALDDVDPLVEASKPVARRLRPFLAEARGFAAGARPTLRDLRLAIRRSGRRNDLIELTFPQTVKALRGATPVIALGRPYTQDFLGWLDDFSTTGAYIDALGGITRTFGSFAENFSGGPPKRNQFHRCPGGADIPLPDGSNVLTREEQHQLGCREEDRAVR